MKEEMRIQILEDTLSLLKEDIGCISAFSICSKLHISANTYYSSYQAFEAATIILSELMDYAIWKRYLPYRNNKGYWWDSRDYKTRIDLLTDYIAYSKSQLE